MSGTMTPPTDPTATGAAPGGGGSGGTSVGGSTSGVTLPTLPPQYATANIGFFTRQTEAVPTAITVGPDGALYVSELNGIPYPNGYSSIYRINGTNTTTGFNGTTPSGVPQAYASGFSQVNGLAFNNATGDLFVLQYVNSNSIYDPTQDPTKLPPSQLINVKPDGTRTTISGPELKLGNYVTVNQQTGEVYVAIDNNGPGTGEVLDYKQDPTTGAWNNKVIATDLNSPRGMAIGPDGNLYVLEQGTGPVSGDPSASTSPVIPFIPGLVSEAGGNSGSITKVDITSGAGGQQTVLTGLASFREFNPSTGQNRVIAIGMNGLTIEPDGTVIIAAGGGLAPETAAAVGPIANQLQGVLKVSGLFSSDPSSATVTPEFNALTYATANGPDGATTQFNTESNLNDIVYNPKDGSLNAVDAARNVVYGISADGKTLNSVTVLQKQPPVLTPPQYTAELAAGGNPTEQYQAEISNVTYKNANSLPNVPGNVPVAAAAPTDAAGAAPTTTGAAGTGSTGSSTSVPATGASGATMTATDVSATSASNSATAPAPHGEDATGPGVTAALGNGATASASASPTTAPTASASASPTAAPTASASASPTAAPTASASASASPTAAPTASASASASPTAAPASTSDSASALPTIPTAPTGPNVLPGPVDPTTQPVLATNIYAPYFDPFFGNYAPAPSDPLALPAGNGGQFTASRLVVFGDRLADNGNTAALEQSLNQAPGQTTAPYSSVGDFSDGPKWTTDLAQMLGATAPGQQQNFAYESATARDLGVPNPFDPDASKTPLDTFAGQIAQFAKQDGSFNANDVVSVTFGGNDISLPSTESPQQGVTDSVNAIISGLQQAADLGAKHFLVSNLPDITLAPLFSEPAFLAATGATQAQFQGLVGDFNSQLASGLSAFQSQTGLDVKTLNLNTLFNGIAATPADYGFTNITQPVLVSTPGASTTPTYNPAIVGQDPQVQHGSLFLDPYFDPTALGQTIIAQTARTTLTA